MRASHILLGTVLVALTGCANLNTVGRSTALPGEGTAIHLDAPQRIAIANKKGWICAEPSPDALQAYASSLGVGFAAPTKESVSLAQTLSASAGSIGLRTQSITLMRDALYRICELYYNGAISKPAAVQLLERSQDLTLGILAIEQLTGAVVAQQVSINSSSAANAAASINDTQKELDKAKADESAKTAAADAAQKALGAQKKKVAEKTTAAAVAKAKAKGTQDKIDDLEPVLATTQTALEKAISDRLTLRLNLVDLQSKVKKLEPKPGELKKQIDEMHRRTLKAEMTYKEALNAVPKEEILIADREKALRDARKVEADTRAELAKVLADLDQAKMDVDATKLAIKAADKPVDDAQGAVEQTAAKLKVLHADTDQAAAEKAIADLKTATDDQTKKLRALEDAQKAAEQAADNSKEIEKLGTTATTSASASGSGVGTFSTLTNRYGVNKDTVDALAAATTQIVQSVLFKGHLTDSCGVMLMSYADDSNSANPRISDEAFRLILPICKEVIQATLAVYRSSAAAATSINLGAARVGAAMPAAVVPLASPAPVPSVK